MSYRSISSVCLITDYASQAGLSLIELLQGSGISVELLNDPNAIIKEEQELKVLENLSALKHDTFQMGMELGSRYQLTSYGMWGYALLASQNLRKAVDLGLRYLDLTYAFCLIELQQCSDKARIVFTPKCKVPLAELVLYRDMWAMMVIPRDLFASNLPSFSLNFKSSKPESLSDEALINLQRQINGDIRFNQDANYVEFDSQYLDMPLPRGNEMTVKMCEQQCQAILDEKQRLGSVAQEIRRIMITHGLQVSMAFVASEMAMTTRTLHRQLKRQGMSWRGLRDDIRCAMAQEWLAIRNIQLDEIAERLGFSDAANFSHAFKRWQGVSPSQYRAGLVVSSDY
jgi:AraC-like DNA-binding protein